MDDSLKDGDWYRTCQECGHKQKAKKPDTTKELTSSYQNAKCRKCKSEALDYGTENNLEKSEDSY